MATHILTRAARFGAVIALALFGLSASAPAQEELQEEQAHEALHFPIEAPERRSWSFDGFFGKFDPAQLRRGLQVYRDVCQNCHALSMVPFRTLADEGGPQFTPEQAAEIAGAYTVTDGPDDQGLMFTRQARLSDHFPSIFANPQAAAFANNGAYPPDLSLMAKARSVPSGFPWFIFDALRFYQEGGPDYIAGFLTGYRDPPPGEEPPPGTYYNVHFGADDETAMPPQLFDGIVRYTDGAPQTVEQYAEDVAAFLMWTAEPHLVARKRLGFQVLIFLAAFIGLMYATKRRVWAPVH
ncbi:MAG: cytochrome c1 [Bauldia sp.]|nr:cytochrome c1 [Bauldia sp.]